MQEEKEAYLGSEKVVFVDVRVYKRSRFEIMVYFCSKK